MKAKSFLVLSVILMVASGLMINAKSTTLRKSDDEGQILIRQQVPDPIGAPRGPVFNPFTAYLQGNYVILNSSASYGDVDVTLMSTAGDNYTTVFDTSDCSILIPISGLAGNYSLLLIDANGAHYVGEFEL